VTLPADGPAAAGARSSGLHQHLASACGRDAQTIVADLRGGKLLTAAAAVDHGLVHELGRPGPGRLTP
jgi:hypothetical protein